MGDASIPGAGTRLDWSRLATLEFEPVDADRFPAPDLALAAIERGGTAGAILNAANEVAVEAFLAGRLPFAAIVRTAAAVAAALPPVPIRRLADVLEADEQARGAARDLVERATAGPPASRAAGSR
jgi:1-deoxy-D-xylulose-5-phosphate reductoisomerase